MIRTHLADLFLGDGDLFLAGAEGSRFLGGGDGEARFLGDGEGDGALSLAASFLSSGLRPPPPDFGLGSLFDFFDFFLPEKDIFHVQYLASE